MDGIQSPEIHQCHLESEHREEVRGLRPVVSEIRALIPNSQRTVN